MTDNLKNSILYLKSIGPKRAKSFEEIGIKTIDDLLFYFPTKYLNRSTILDTAKILQLKLNGYEGEVTIIGKVVNKELIRYNRKQIFKVQMKDSSGYFECIWFNTIRYFKDLFKDGNFYAVSAKPSVTRYGHLQFVHPDFDKLDDKESRDFLNTGKIIPFYRLPKELKSVNIGEFSIRKIIHSILEIYPQKLDERLPENLLKTKNLLPIEKAIINIHSPQNMDLLNSAIKRFKFEELFYIEILVALRKRNYHSKLKGFPFKIHSGTIKQLLSTLPFKLTNSQLKVLSEIRKDMEAPHPMNRLLQGDVGSGKTIVALIAMLIAADNNYQAVLMAPTEILADQHFKNISKLLEKFNYEITLIIGGQKKKERELFLSKIEKGLSKIIIGTHALFEEKVKFKNLGLIITDEQHRFGVIQRARLVNKGISPDVIVMSATPIPRTLTMTVYGDLDLSVISEMPENRKPVKTFLRGESKLPEIYNFIKSKISEGDQAFIVYPLVEESDKLDLKAAEEYYMKLSNEVFKNYSVGMIHGKMNWKNKEEIMLKFAAKEFSILISTTVIEVGIDIPDANIIVINDAFRFGLSQLHQLRGRVGRSGKQAYCILISKDKYISKSIKTNFNFDYLSKKEIEKYKSAIRLNSMVKYQDGFKLSEIDLKLRGPGNIFGTAQSGFPELKYADIVEDADILADAKKEAFEIIREDARLSLPENQIIKNNLLKYYSEQIKLSQIA